VAEETSMDVVDLIAKLKDLREERGISQSKLCKGAGKGIGITGSYLSYIEAGHRSPRLDTASRLARALGFELRFALEPIVESDVEE
jgi:transcriptional regulator with XRE-family HTH domain